MSQFEALICTGNWGKAKMVIPLDLILDCLTPTRNAIIIRIILRRAYTHVSVSKTWVAGENGVKVLPRTEVYFKMCRTEKHAF